MYPILCYFTFLLFGLVQSRVLAIVKEFKTRVNWFGYIDYQLVIKYTYIVDVEN